MRVRTLYRNGHVYVPTRGYPTAVLVDDSRVLWLGTETEADAQVDAADRVVDLHGRLVTTPFVDAMQHLGQHAEVLACVDLSGTTSLADALDRVAAAFRASAVTPVAARDYDETRWPETRSPTPEELARASGGRPFLMMRVGRVAGVATPALRARCAADGVDVGDWGDVLRREQVHDAGMVVPLVRPAQEMQDVAIPLLRRLAALGVGGLHGHVQVPSRVLGLTRDEMRTLRLPIVHTYLEHLCSPFEDPAEIVRDLHLTGLTVSLDGPATMHRAALVEPYLDRPRSTGPATPTPEALTDHLVACTRAGVQSGALAVGDRAAQVLVESLRTAVRAAGLERFRGLRHRAVLNAVPDDRALGTLIDLGVQTILTPQVDRSLGGPDGVLTRRLGPTRAAHHARLASLAAPGLFLALASAAPFTGSDPWETLRGARWHRDDAERMSMGEAFRHHTVAGWAAVGEDSRGFLDVGRPADLVVWDLPPDALAGEVADRLDTPGLPRLVPGTDNPRALLTVVGGRVIHEIEGALE